MHKPFKDNAGYTRYCWECKHAHGWVPITDQNIREYDRLGYCDRLDRGVTKYDSPNNPRSIVAGCEHYER